MPQSIFTAVAVICGIAAAGLFYFLSENSNSHRDFYHNHNNTYNSYPTASYAPNVNDNYSNRSRSRRRNNRSGICAICHTALGEICIDGFDCVHSFHRTCLNNEFPGRNQFDTCPLCQNGRIESCPVCLEDLDVSPCKRLFCNHVFHFACIEQWLQVRGGAGGCPTCRQQIQI